MSTFDVADLRADKESVGRHRDGWARVTQWGWAPQPTLERVVGDMVANAVRLGGGTVGTVSPGALRLHVDVLEADVTDDGLLAGVETFGRAKIRLVATDAAGAEVANLTESKAFAVDDEQDPGLLGPVLYDLVAKAVQSVGQSARQPSAI